MLLHCSHCFETPPAAPIISENLFFSPGSLSSTLTCISTASPATTVTFVRNSDTTLTLRDGEEATDANGVTYQLTQTVTNRQQSTYSSILTINQSLAGILGSNFTCSVANVLGTSAVSEQLQIMGKYTAKGKDNMKYSNWWIRSRGHRDSYTLVLYLSI